MAQNSETPTFDRTLTHGPLRAALWKIAWPTILINVFSGLQGIVDHLMVGRFVGYQANAAVGVSWQIFVLFIVFVSSLYGGMGVLIARFAGADEPRKVHRAFSQAFLVSCILSVGVFAPLGYALAPTLLNLVHAAPEVRAEALPYLRILFLFNLGLVLFFLAAAALRAAGDARTPMRLTLLMTAVNIVTTIVLVRGPGPIPALGVRGAGISTVGSGALVACLALYRLVRGRFIVRFQGLSGLIPDPRMIREIFRFGLPMGFQGIALHVGAVLLIRYVGSLEASAEAQAAYAVAHSQVFLIINLISAALMASAATVAGQSLGAGRPERAARVPTSALAIGFSTNVPLALAFFLFPQTLLGLFGLEDPRVLSLGLELLRYLSLSSLFLTAAYVYIGTLQGTGDTAGAMVITLVAQVVVPVGFCALLDQTLGLTASRIWLAVALGHLTRFGLAFLRFRQGRWREIRIDVGDSPGGER